MRIRTTTATTAGALALAASVAWSAPALAAAPEPAAPGTVLLSNEAYEANDSLHRVGDDEPRLILTDPSYRAAWLFCLRSAEPSHVERNAWGSGYVCIPDGAVQ